MVALANYDALGYAILLVASGITSNGILPNGRAAIIFWLGPNIRLTCSVTCAKHGSLG